MSLTKEEIIYIKDNIYFGSFTLMIKCYRNALATGYDEHNIKRAALLDNDLQEIKECLYWTLSQASPKQNQGELSSTE